MDRIVLFSDRPRWHQIASVLIVPAVFGAICGIVLGASAGAYWALQVVAAIGGLLAGMEHLAPREAALRGLVGGTMFGAFLLVAHEVSGATAEADIGDPEILLVVVTAVAGALLGAAGGALRRRHTAA